MSVNTDSADRGVFIVNDFSGGMRLNADPVKDLEPNEYFLLVNGRNRDGRIRPVKLPSEIGQNLPAGRIQGIKAAGTYLMVFKGGRMFYRNYGSAIMSEFTENGLFAPLSPDVDRIYTCLVPSSSNNFKRVPASANPSEGIILTNPVDETPACLVVQDGIGQPRLVAPDGAVSVAQTFAEWTVDKRQYVPKGRMMLYYDGKLYIISPDGKEMFHSVTNRPLDFVIALQGDNAEKMADGIFAEEASRLSYRVDYNLITCIAELDLPTEDSNVSPGFYVSTAFASYRVIPLYSRTLFGEPTFRRVPLLSTGAFNQYSIAKLLGDYAVIDVAGIRSFSAAQMFGDEGQESFFSRAIQNLFEDTTIQTNPCIGSFNGYTLFSVKTKYGSLIIVYDNTIDKFVALDIYPGIGEIKQFEEVRIDGVRKLFFYDSNDKLYEAFAGATAQCDFYPREWSGYSAQNEQKPLRVHAIFSKVSESGTVTVSVYTDEKLNSNPLEETLTATVNSTPTLPYGHAADKDSIRTLNFTFSNLERCWKYGAKISWNCQAELSHIEPVTEQDEVKQSEEEAANAFQ